MRGLWSTIALLVTLIALASYVYFVTWRTPEIDTGTKLDKVFAELQTDEIDELRVKSASGETTALKKADDAWQLQAPVTDKADEAEVSGLISNLGTVEVSRVIDENPPDLTPYGLGPPRIEIEFKAGGDAMDKKLLIGDKSPTGAQLFAKRNDEKRVFLIPGFLESTFNRSAFDLRDKTLLKVDLEKVDGLEVVADGKTLQLNKDGTNWKITKPVQARADYGAVEGLIGRLQTSQMKAIVTGDAAPSELKKYGLDKPTTTVNVSAGSSRAALLVGAKTPDNTFYARDLSRPMVFTIDATLVDDFRKGADELRRRDLFEFRGYNASRIEVTRDGQTVALEMTKDTGENGADKWRRVSPNPADLDQDKAQAFLTKLSNLRAIAFADSSEKTGLETPTLTVHAKFDETKEERVNFGKVGSNVYAAPPGAPDIAKVDVTEFNDGRESAR